MNDWLIRSKSGPIMIKHHPTLNVWCLSNGMILSSKDIPHQKVVFKGRNCPDKDGYYRYHVNGKTRKIHRLIAETFISNPEHKTTVDHIDRNIHNNDVSNLRWATDLEQKHNTSKTVACKQKYGFSRWENPKKYHSLYNAEYRSEHKEELQANHRKWIQTHQEHNRTYHTAYMRKWKKGVQINESR